MRMTVRRTAIVLTMLLPTIASAQMYDLSEAPKAGDCYRITVETDLAGAIKVAQDSKEAAIKLSAKNEHVLFERVLDADKGVVRKSARYYEKALSQAEVGDGKVQRELRDSRRLVVAQRFEDNLLCYSPVGPLTRSELEVVSEHFDTLCLTGILAGKEVAIGDSWKLSNGVAQALCLFDGLISHDLTAKLAEVKDGNAVITIDGKAGGIESGAAVKLEITATARFDLLNHRLISLNWKQKDTRDQGPASPASQVESQTIVQRVVLNEEPRELSKGAIVAVPQENEPPELLKLLQFNDPGNRYTFLFSRGWQVVGRTDNHLVMRLMDRGDFVAQATIAVLKKQEPGKHLTAEDFTNLVSESPGWVMDEISDAGELPTDAGRWIYRITAKGELDGTKVMQNFVLLAGAQGDQLAVTFTMKPANAAKIGTRDLALVNAIEFVEKKK
jgi:hypothetical protein